MATNLLASRACLAKRLATSAVASHTAVTASRRSLSSFSRGARAPSFFFSKSRAQLEMSQRSQRSHQSWTSPPPPPPPPSGPGFFSKLSAKLQYPLRVVSEIISYSRVQLLVGITLGGLAASAAGLMYFTRLRDEIDLRRIYKGMDKIRIHIDRSGGNKTPNNNNNSSSSSNNGVPNSTVVDASVPDGEVVVVEGGDQKQPSEIIVIDARPDSEFSLPLPVITVAGWSIMFALTASWAWYQARHRLQSRRFLSHINYSLNFLDNNTLRFRTIKETTLSTILPDNPAAVTMTMQAARAATLENPIVQFPTDFKHFMNNSILNSISPMFRHGYLASDFGVPMHTAAYRYCLTFEPEAATVRKFRVMLAREELLESILKMETPPNFESPSHRHRWETLKTMAKIFKSEKGQDVQTVPMVEIRWPLHADKL